MMCCAEIFLQCHYGIPERVSYGTIRDPDAAGRILREKYSAFFHAKIFYLMIRRAYTGPARFIGEIRFKLEKKTEALLHNAIREKIIGRLSRQRAAVEF